MNFQPSGAATPTSYHETHFFRRQRLEIGCILDGRSGTRRSLAIAYQPLVTGALLGRFKIVTSINPGFARLWHYQHLVIYHTCVEANHTFKLRRIRLRSLQLAQPP